MKFSRVVFCAFLTVACAGEFQDVKQTDTFRHIKAHLDQVPAIDTHDHLKPLAVLQGTVRTAEGVGMTLFSLWNSSCYTWIQPVTRWPESGQFDEWWPKAKNDFNNARATSFYRYQLPAFTDLYGVDFEKITDDQARDLNRRIFANYQSEAWIYEVVTERANIELMFIGYTMAKRAYQEWLEVMPSNHLLWGADAHHVEGIYGATEFTRRCLAEALAEKVERGELSQEQALHIGQQVLRDNALELFPRLKDRLWKHRGKLAPPEK